MTPRVKEAWAMTGLVVVGMTGFATYQVYRNSRLGGFDLGAAILTFAFCGLVTALGVALAWWRLFRDRAARKRQGKPLNLG